MAESTARAYPGLVLLLGAVLLAGCGPAPQGSPASDSASPNGCGANTSAEPVKVITLSTSVAQAADTVRVGQVIEVEATAQHQLAIPTVSTGTTGVQVLCRVTASPTPSARVTARFLAVHQGRAVVSTTIVANPGLNHPNYSAVINVV